jgi:hypothetical protein
MTIGLFLLILGAAAAVIAPLGRRTVPRIRPISVTMWRAP